MTTLPSPADIRQRALRRWHDFLRAHLTDRPLLPMVIRVGRIGGRALSENFEILRSRLAALRAGEKTAARPGYRIEYRQVNHRRLGEQELPARIVIEEAEDYLAVTGRGPDFARFREISARILEQWPELRELLVRRPGLVLKFASAWPRLLDVAAWLREHPRPGCYIREMDIPGVDSKFVEGHRAILAEILGLVLPPAAIDQDVHGLAGHGFERRFGLAWDQPLVRFRLLDPGLAMAGLRDLSVPLADFRRLDPPCSRVFITENKISGLAFPDLAGAMVIFGLGYGISALQDVPWLGAATRQIFYWGDIDTHGFAILSQVRGYFPAARSLLMDRETLLAHRRLWGREEDSKRHLDPLPHLEKEENSLYLDLRDNRLGDNIRLEQERIRFSVLQQALDTID